MILFSAAGILRFFSPFNSSIPKSDLNLALKLLLCLGIVMNPLFRIDFSISDSLKIVRKSVLIYETIIMIVSLQKSKMLKNKYYVFLKTLT